MGTLSYLSPEQAEGQDGGCAIRHLFAGRRVSTRCSCGTRPFRGDTTLAQLASILREAPEPPGTLRPRTSEGPRTDHPAMPGKETRSQVRVSARTASRIGSMSDAEDARRTSRAVGAVAALVLVIALGVAGLQVYRSSRARWAEKEALPEVARLVDGSRFLAAVALLRQAEPYVPNSPELIRLKANLPTGTVRISTMPEGADVYIRDYADTEPGDPEWRLLGRSPVQTDMVPQSYFPRGTYRVTGGETGFRNRRMGGPPGPRLSGRPHH